MANGMEFDSFHTSPLQNLLPLHYTLTKPDQKNRPTWPHLGRLVVRSNHGLEPAPIANTLDNARDKRGAVQHAHLLGYANVGVDERIIIRDHVLVRCFGGDRVFQGVGRSLEEETPQRTVDKME